jgi:signal transduction histidine kinase
MSNFKAIVLNKTGDQFTREVKSIDKNYLIHGYFLVKVDYDEFVQSLTNLIRNSIQAISSRSKNTSSQFSGRIRLKIEKADSKVQLLVEDNGSGIESAHLEKLFSTHFTTKSNRDGTGLGLSISRRFIRSFNGDLFLKETFKDKGTTMVIELPLSLNEVREVG